MIIESPDYQYQLYDWFSIDSYWMNMVVLDHNMVFRYYGNSIPEVLSLVEEIISETNWIFGDINNDDFIDILDILVLVNYIINEDDYNYLSDMNQDFILNIQDIILLLNIVLSN